MTAPAAPSSTGSARRTSAGGPSGYGQGNPFPLQDLDSLAMRLSDPTLDIKVKISLATELRDTIDMVSRDLDPTKFCATLLPCILAMLRTGKVALISTSPENRLRNTLIQIIHRLPQGEPLRPHMGEIMTVLLELFRIENEENGILLLKIIVDFHRSYSRAPGAPPLKEGERPDDEWITPVARGAEALLDIIASFFKGMPSVVEEIFSVNAATPGASSSASTEDGSPGAAMTTMENESPAAPTVTVLLAPGSKSFKLLQDCPAAIVFLFQTYTYLAEKAVNWFVPLVFDFLSLEAAPQARKHASMEAGKNWVGVAPELPKAKRQQFFELVNAQTKTISFLAYMIRVPTSFAPYTELLPHVVVRLMKDCPSEAVAMRRDLLVATRHILQSDLKTTFIGQIDTLLDHNVLVGAGVTGHESLRPLAYSMLADLIHHVRAELTLSQLSRIIHMYSANVHDPTLASAIQTMCSKLLLNLVEPLSSKEPEEACKIMYRILTTFVSKMEAIAEMRDEWFKWSKVREPLPTVLKNIAEREAEREKALAPQAPEVVIEDKADGDVSMVIPEGDETVAMEVETTDEAKAAKAEPAVKEIEAKKKEVVVPPPIELDDVDIERSKPIGKMVVMVDASQDPVKDAKFLFRNLLFGFKTIAASLSRLPGGWPNAEMMCRFFEAAVKCMVLFEPSRDQGREMKEVMEVFTSTLVQMDLLVFQEVLEYRMEFFLRELIRNHELLVIPQNLLSNELVSQNFAAILLRFLSARLGELGKANKDYTSVMLRLYKMSFMAVTIFPEKNEPVLLPHLSHLIMNSLKLASQAAEPNSYYVLLRALFRSIGGGRFEILYKEVLPLLQVLLEQLNALLKAADSTKRDLFAELILTVPVRLSVLLPYLSYLMRPLVHALQAGPDLVSQGLRTLELCVDNLTQEFLNPLMAPVIDEVMIGLWKLLRPVPFNHQHAHTTMRILGKIGGRNRKGFQPPKLEWRAVGEEALLHMKFEGKDATLRVAPIVDVALKIIRRGDVHYRRVAYSFLKYAVVLFLKDGLAPGEPEDTFGNILRGLFDATRVEEFSVDANQYIIDLAQHIFALELGKELPENPALAKQVLPLCSALLDGIIENLCGAENSDLPKAAAQTQKIVEDLLATRNVESTTNKHDPPTVLLHQLGSRLCSLGYDPSWQRKTGAAVGLSILTTKVNLETKWILDHEIEFTRALLFSLKDMPGDSPSNADMITETLLEIVRLCNSPGVREASASGKPQLTYVAGLFLVELCSQISAVRDVVKKALKIISEATNTSIAELLMPVRERLTSPIFTKPLRALGFTMQIGHIDAVTYCITLKPPLIEFDEQLSRLLHEALGIADAEDAALIGSKSTIKTTAPLTQLRVVCVQLLSAALAAPDFLNTQKQIPVRTKALTVCFKLLYAKAPEVVEASYLALKQVMNTQGKLPRDLLQNGLKPVLMNLADHKRLSVASLEGLARLLQLLTNYFKVEIGHKLVDHFRNLAVPSDMIRAATKQPSEDETLEVMAAIINIFRLLPQPAAAVFLEEVVKQVVEVERHLKKLKASIFTTPLTQYLVLYPVETATFMFNHLADERFIATFRAVLASEHAGPLRDHITEGAEQLFAPCFASDGDLGYHAALMIKELIACEKDWIVKCPAVLPQLIQRWVSDIRRQRLSTDGDFHFQQLREDTVIVDIFIAYLEQAENIDLLFHMVDVYTFWNSANHTTLSRFLTQHVALSTDVVFKRKILDRFIDIFENAAVTKAHKTASLRLLVNPIILISSSRGARESAVLDLDYLNKIHHKIWKPLLTANSNSPSFDDEAMRIELCHMSTLILKGYSHLILENKKDVVKFAWLNLKFDDITVTQSAYVLIAKFLERYESPSKIVIQIYVALLKAHQPEARGLVREALDILAPALPKRIVLTATDSPSGHWSHWTRRVFLDDSTNMALMVNVFQLIVRHSDLFYDYRELYIPHMVAALAKLSQTSSSVVGDTRVLTLDIIELILKWEKKRIEAGKKDDGKMEVDEGVVAVADGKKSPKRTRPDRSVSVAPSAASAGPTIANVYYVVPSPIRDQIVNNLLRFLANSTEGLTRNNLVARALGLFREFIGPNVWSDFIVKLAFFSKTFATHPVDDEHLVILSNSAEVLNVVVSTKTPEWILSNLAILHRIVEKGFGSTEFRVHSPLRPVLERLFEVLPPNLPSTPEELAAASPEIIAAVAFVEWATTSINTALKELSNVPGAMMILQAWAKASPDKVDQFFGLLIRVFSRYTKEHISSPTPVSSADPALRLLVSSLEVLRQRVSFLGDHRRWFLSGIVQLVEKSSNLDVCRFLLQMTRKWVNDKEESHPTNKEKAGILLKMMSFETRNSETLQKEFLTLILDIYTDPTLARSELTVKLEPAFLIGCKTRDPVIRSKFLAVFDKSLATGLFTRLHYILGVQSWETLSETYWMHQALDLVLGAVDTEDPLFHNTASPSLETPPSNFVTQLSTYTTGDLLGAARKLLYADPAATHTLWISTFSTSWTCLSRREQLDLTRFLITLLTKEYHLRSVDRRPNVVQTLLAGALACTPTPSLPPHLVRYLGKTFNSWHTGIEILQEALENPREEESVRESTLDALAETFSELSEDDLFYGLWRRRAGYNETNVAISWEQIGQWTQAQVLYESAQITARSGVLPFTESEMALWEDHWILTAQKLQQWDILADLAKNEGNKELLLESAWRLSDWTTESDMVEAALASMSPVATPRKRIFDAYLALVKSQTVKPAEDGKKMFNKLCDEGIQLSLRKWFYLPEMVSQAHIPLLQVFQQFVELQEAQQIFTVLAGTNVTNLDSRAQEVKSTLITWRDRLPNLWDDINVWSDLVAWRQHIFSAINKAYLPLIPGATNPAGGQNSTSFGYRGYHETAWIINRFAHVARKHHLNDVCITSLTKIYTLPNIEIQEAFLKLREQAKCHYQNSSELANGLEVINNTNLMYFNASQKAEFFTLKGMFLAKLHLHDEASQVFNLAVSMEMNFPKAWAEWGEYQDRMFKEHPQDLNIAANAVSCYLQAAGLYKSHKVRKLLVRILWLLSLDDMDGTIARAFDNYKGEVPTWYWITFIPQLLLALSQREARYARVILMKIAKTFPQSLYFQLRTIRDDLAIIKRQHAQRAAAAAAAAAGTQATAPDGTTLANPPAPGTLPQQPTGQSSAPQQPGAQQPTPQQPTPQQMYPTGSNPNGARQPWEHVDEIMAILKTAFPLLALSMEMIVDQVSNRFKPSPDEDIFRLISALLADSMQQYVGRAVVHTDDGLLSQVTISNVARFAENLHPPAVKARFEKDFLTSKPTLREYLQRLREWRDRYETLLNKRAKRANLESVSHWLVEFQYQKFDEIEVPGQYLKHEDNNANYVRISHFANKYDVTRSHGVYFRRITMLGHDGSVHRFAIQVPSVRTSRREERIMQLFRMLNCPLATRKESRKRNLFFNIPIIVPLAPGVRLVENDASITSLQDIFEQYCDSVGMRKEDPILAHTERIRALHRVVPTPARHELWSGRLEIAEEIAYKMVPDDILKRYMIKTMATPSELWHIRKQMTLQMASFIFLTYVMSMGARVPSRIHISRSTGHIYTSDMLPSIVPNKPEFVNSEAVPFRYTPNLQRFITPIGTEGLLTSSIMAIARSLTESEYDLEHCLSIFIREEVLVWVQMSKIDPRASLRELVLANVDAVVRRAKVMSCKLERDSPASSTIPVNQSILELMLAATSPQNLSRVDSTFAPWL